MGAVLQEVHLRLGKRALPSLHTDGLRGCSSAEIENKYQDLWDVAEGHQLRGRSSQAEEEC